MEKKDKPIPIAEMLEPKFIENIKNNMDSMNKKCASYRGLFIHAVTQLETQIDEILTLYFCPNDKIKREELLYVLLSTDRMTLMNKYQLLSFIMHGHYQDFYDKHSPKPTSMKKNSIPPDSLDTRVQNAIDLRNKFAHRRIIKGIKNTLNFDGENISLDLKHGKKGEIISKNLPLMSVSGGKSLAF